jgi:transaldolase
MNPHESDQKQRLTPRPQTRILVDGGDPEETKAIKDALGFVDGQTTNPSLIAKNPEIARLVSSGHKLTEQQEADEYRNIVGAISPLVGDAGVSIEVFADLSTTADRMYQQGRDMFSWIPNAYVKYPCTSEGFKAAERSVREGIRVNMTLCFSQPQAAAVYAATRGTRAPAYVSPFIGRLDDIGQNGVDLLSNIKRMYAKGDGHALILAASIRSLAHLLYCFSIRVDLVTVPAKILHQWADAGFPMPDAQFTYTPAGTRIEYRDIELDQPWQSFNIEHELTTKGVEKFAADYRATLYPKAS